MPEKTIKGKVIEYIGYNSYKITLDKQVLTIYYEDVLHVGQKVELTFK